MTNVLTIGYDRHVFDAGSSTRTRMRACAAAAGEIHMVVFSRSEHGYHDVHDGPLHIYPTGSHTRMGMVRDAYRIGAQLLAGGDPAAWVVSPQDPFEAGLIGYLLHQKSGVALQIQLHGDFFGNRWWRTSGPGNGLREWFGRWLVRRATCVRAVSKRVVRSLVKLGIPEARIATLSIVTDMHTDTEAPPSSQLRTQCPDADTIVLTAGRLVRSKHFDHLIDVWQKVHAQHPRAQLVIVGSGPEEDALRTQVAARNLDQSIGFIPWTDDLPALLRDADIFVFPSSYEGWGRVILEAMAAGLPGVVTDVGCVGEVFHDGTHGIVVPIGDDEALVRGITILIEDAVLRHRYGIAGRIDAAAHVGSHEEYAAAWARTLHGCVQGEEAV